MMVVLDPTFTVTADKFPAPSMIDKPLARLIDVATTSPVVFHQNVLLATNPEPSAAKTNFPLANDAEPSELIQAAFPVASPIVICTAANDPIPAAAKPVEFSVKLALSVKDNAFTFADGSQVKFPLARETDPSVAIHADVPVFDPNVIEPAPNEELPAAITFPESSIVTWELKIQSLASNPISIIGDVPSFATSLGPYRLNENDAFPDALESDAAMMFPLGSKDEVPPKNDT